MIPPDDRAVGGARLYIRSYEPHRSAQPLAWSPKYYLSSLLPRRRCRCPAGPARRRPAAARPPPPPPPLPGRCPAATLPRGAMLPIHAGPLRPAHAATLSKHGSSMQTSCGMKGRAEGEREGTGGCPDGEDAERRCVKIKEAIRDSYSVVDAYCTLLK